MEENLEKVAYRWITEVPELVDVQSDYYCKTRDVFSARLSKMLDDLLESRILKDDYVYLVSAMTGEIGNNSFDHNLGNWPDIMGIFFGYIFAGRKLKIILADRGKGIFGTLKKAMPALKNDEEALKIAFTEKISGRFPENRGNGLKFVKENIKILGIHLSFISGNAQAQINKQMQIKEINENIRGCLAILST